MARDTDALKIKKWAGAWPSNRQDVPTSLRTQGWFQEYSLVGGIPGPERLYVNQLLAQLTALGEAANARGVPLPWSESNDYQHPAFATGNNGLIYVSVQASGPATGNATNPTTDTAKVYWRPY